MMQQRERFLRCIGREIAVAVKEGGGPDPANNSRLRDVIAKAKANNMPNDTIDRGIKKGSRRCQFCRIMNTFLMKDTDQAESAIIVDDSDRQQEPYCMPMSEAHSQKEAEALVLLDVFLTCFDKKGQIIIA